MKNENYIHLILYLRNSVAYDHDFIVSSPSWDQGGDDFCVISQAGGQLLNFKSQGGDTFRGKMILGSQAGGTALS